MRAFSPNRSGWRGRLHREFLKSAGFRKEGSTFSRERDGYVEQFNFQGSSWSASTETRFYLNVGVEFAEFIPDVQNWVCFKRTHWASRLDELVPTAREDLRYREAKDPAVVHSQLAMLIATASDQIAAHLSELRAAYLARVARCATASGA